VAISLRYTLLSLWRRRRTALASAAGIALLVFVLAASRMLAAGLSSTMLRAGRTDRALVLQLDAWAEAGSRVRGTIAELVAGAPGVKRDGAGIPRVASETAVAVSLSRAGDRASYSTVQVRGVTPESYALRPYVRVVEGRAPKPGTTEAIVGSGIAGRYAGLALGERFELQKSRSFVIVGRFDAEQTAYESEVWADLEAVRSAMNWHGFLSSITAELESERAFPELKRTLEADKRNGIAVTRERDYYEKISQGMAKMIGGIGDLVGFVFSFGAALGAAITMYAAVSERRRELGVLRALGFRRRALLLGILIESAVLALAGGTFGALAAWLTRFLRFSTMNYATGELVSFPFLPSISILATAMASGLVVGVLGGIFPAWRAARVDPVAAMRD
jgi:putative ABC transport system permease protein